MILMAGCIALPIAYFLNTSINRFFYAYPMKIGPGIFIFTIAVTMFVAFFTVASQAFRAAQANPVESLKYE